MSTRVSLNDRNDISLTKIYEALTKPHSSLANRSLHELHAASPQQIDYTLRKLLSYSKHELAQWPPRRLIRCLDYIYIHGIKPHSEERLSIVSFKACVRWSLKILELREEENTEFFLQIQATIKFICTLLENNSKTESIAFNDLITVIRHHRGVESLLHWLQSTNQPIQLYSVRALTACVQHFAKDIIKLNGYIILSQLLSNIPSLLVTLSFKPPVTDAAQRQKELDQCVMICRLLDSTIKFDCSSSKPEKECKRFADSTKAFSNLADVWASVCHDNIVWIVNKDTVTLIKLKNLKFLVYSLTSIIQNCVSRSKTAGLYVGREVSRDQWQPLLALLMEQWVRNTCCYADATLPSISSAMEQDKSIIAKLLQISIHTLPEPTGELYLPHHVHQMLKDIGNFLMAFVSQPILPEDAAMIGTPELIHKSLRIDVEERGYRVTSEILDDNQSLLVLLLESLIRYVQSADKQVTESIACHVSWCLKSLLTILLNTDQLETSGLNSRISKLIVFFLHFDESIDTLAASTTNISSYVWGPTIDTAKQGLTAAIALSPDIDMTPMQASVIYKAKRAFVALQKISKHSRACERLVDCDVLQLVNTQLIPKGEVMETFPALLSVYALFVQFIAALSRRTAFVRTRLRDECGLFPMIMKLMQEAVALKGDEGQSDQVTVGWNRLISSCLLVISAFQYDESSMRMWLSSTEKQTVLPLVLTVLFPWRHRESLDAQAAPRCLHVDYEVVVLAAQALDQLSTIPACGRQMMMDKRAMSDLSRLLVCSVASCSCTDKSDQNSIISTIEEVEKSNLEEEEGEEEEPLLGENTTEEAHFDFRESLKRTAIRIFSSHENIQYIILSDSFTTFFRRLIGHPFKGTIESFWMYSLCEELYVKKGQDYWNLFSFTEYGEQATRLHEFTAIALTYLAFGGPNWNHLLGLTVLEGDIVSGKSIFSILCQMLVYGLEYETEDSDFMEQDTQETEEVQALISSMTPMRRNAAAQAIEVLALVFEEQWLSESTSLNNAAQNVQPLKIDDSSDTVKFSTEDAVDGAYVSGNRQLLQARSPVFQALLGDMYAESKQDVILLHDVTFHSLEYFMNILHHLNEIDMTACWDDIIGLLQASDRFGAVDVRNLCECWVFKNVVTMSENIAYRKEGLEGAIRLFRLCRDPIEKDGGITSNTWPFARVLRECLKCITQYMSESSKTEEFLKMVQESNIEELNAFCDGLATLLQM